MTGYANHDILAVGKRTLWVSLPGGSTETAFYVVDGNCDITLLGLPAIKALGLTPKVARVSKIEEAETRAIVKYFPKVFSELSKV